MLYKYWILLPLTLLLLLELALRLFWVNPYGLYAELHPGFRLHEPGLVAYAKIEGDLYPGDHRIRFAVGADRSVTGTADRAPSGVVALGGSTTECGLLPESGRWPDLLGRPAYNYGVSGNFSLDSFHNLEYLLGVGQPVFDRVLLMHGVNDLGRFLSGGLREFTDWAPRPISNVLADADAADQPLLFGLQVRESALLSFIRYQSNNLKGRNFFPSLQLQWKAQQGLPELEQEGFFALRQRLEREMLPARRQVYEQIAGLARENRVRLLLLTQPHAYGPEYRPAGTELRLFPVYRGHRLSPEQATAAMGLLNDQTRELAADLGVPLIDVAECFSAGDNSSWFYDSVHYTPAGAARFAACVDAGM